MTGRLVALALMVSLLAGAPLAAAQEDPFAEDEDPFADSEDPFAEYEGQVNDTVEATEDVAGEDGDDGSDDGGDDNGSSGDAAEDEETNDSPGFGIGLVAVGLAAAIGLARRD